MASIPNNGYAEVMSGSNNYTGSNSFDGSCPQTAIAPVAANDLCNRLYVDTIAGNGTVVAVVAGNNIDITGTTPSPVVNLKSPLTSTLALGTQNITGTTSVITLTDNAAVIEMGGNGIIPTLYGHQGINRQDPGALIIQNSVPGVSGGGGIQLNCVSGTVSTQGAFQPQRILDTAGGSGIAGQVLSSLGAGTGTSWINDGGTPTITDTNANAPFYPVFVAGSGVQPLLADIATTTTSINPSNGNFSVVDTLKLTQDTVSIGKSAGVAQAAGGVAVGNFAGNGSQGAAAVAIGFAAGQTNQAASTIAIGGTAGQTNQAAGATAVGYGAGNANQGNSATAVGTGAGGSGQGAYAVAIGTVAGSTNQGANAIAIGRGAGETSQTAGSICLNASGVALNSSVAGCFINPIRGVALGIGVGRVFYNTTTFELQYSTT